jgi:hypothetical protein
MVTSSKSSPARTAAADGIREGPRRDTSFEQRVGWVERLREWLMQCASAMVLVAFAASTWIAGQRFIEHGVTRQPAHILNLGLPCGDGALVGSDRTEIARRQLRSCVLARR